MTKVKKIREGFSWKQEKNNYLQGNPHKAISQFNFADQKGVA